MRKFLPKFFNKPTGFTLIELMIVIAIIAILATIGFAVYSGIQSRARDSRREAEVTSIVNALEANKDQGTTVYPAISAAWFGNGSVPIDPNNNAANTATYNLVYSTGAGDKVTIVAPTVNGSQSWPVTSSTIPTSNFILTTGTGTITPITVATSKPGGGILSNFYICARLENTITVNGFTTNVFCKPSSQ